MKTRQFEIWERMDGSLDRTIASRDQSHTAGGWKDALSMSWSHRGRLLAPGNTVPNGSQAGLSIADTAQPFEIDHAEPMNIFSPIFLALYVPLSVYSISTLAPSTGSDSLSRSRLKSLVRVTRVPPA